MFFTRSNKMRAGKYVGPAMAFFVATLMGSAPVLSMEGSPAKAIVISADQGGSVVKYAQRVSIARHNKTQVKFKGKCQSACTMFLSLPKNQACISRGASFTFHRAFGASRDMNEWATQYMLKNYPDWVVRWINQNGGLSRKLLQMNYSYASQYLPTCGNERQPETVARNSTRSLEGVAHYNTRQPERVVRQKVRKPQRAGHYRVALASPVSLR